VQELTVCRTVYQARAEHLRRLALVTDDQGARLILLWAAYDYDLMAKGIEPDETDWHPRAKPN